MTGIGKKEKVMKKKRPKTSEDYIHPEILRVQGDYSSNKLEFKIQD